MAAGRLAAGVQLKRAALAVLLGVLALAPAAADGAVLHPCGLDLSCGRVAVPLDPTGQVPGTVRLAVQRYVPSGDASQGTVVAIAGGPGQSSIDFLFSFADDLHAALGHRALVVFDARGIGRSDRLRCRVPKGTEHFARDCANQLGPRRAFYSTMRTVDDLDAVRTALGLQRISIEGVSYGTYVALSYARAHPDHVERLLLDSTLPEKQPFDLDSVAAMRRVLAGVCATDCPAIAPLQDLSAALTRFPGPGLFRFLTHTQASSLMYDALFESDLHPFVRASLPAALHLAARGDFSAFARLSLLSFGAAATDAARSARATALYDAAGRATRCEDMQLPWSAGDDAATRKAKLRAAAEALPADAVAPFDQETLLAESVAAECIEWPEAGDAPEVATGPLPDVPALLISGTQDIRTPTEVAARVAAQFPHGTLLTVPNVGHAVLGSSGCATRAVQAFFAGQPIAQCGARPAAHVDPLPPLLDRLVPSGAARRPGRVMSAIALTLRHDVGLSLQPLSPLHAVDGTWGGSVVASRAGGRDRLRLRRLSYVHGVDLSGRLVMGRPAPVFVGRLVVRVRGHRYGAVRLRDDFSIRGRLGGRPVRLSRAARYRLAAKFGLFDIPLG